MTCDFRCPLDLCLLVVQAPCVQLACLTLLFIFRLCFACMLFPDCYCLTGVHWIPYYLITWPPYAHTHSQELSRSVTFWSCERHLCSLWQNTFKLGQMEFVSPFFFPCLFFLLSSSLLPLFDLFVMHVGGWVCWQEDKSTRSFHFNMPQIKGITSAHMGTQYE